MNETHAYPAWWLTEPASAFPEPQGRMPTGVFIACSQSGRSISPLMTYRNTTQSIILMDPVWPTQQCGIKYTVLHNFWIIYSLNPTILSAQTEASQTSCSRPSPETMMMPSHSGSDISRMSSLAWFWRSETNYEKKIHEAENLLHVYVWSKCFICLVMLLWLWCVTCLYKVVADVGFSDHWQDVGLTPLHRLASPTEGIDQ